MYAETVLPHWAFGYDWGLYVVQAVHPERPPRLSIGYDSHHPAVPISMKLLGMKSINSSIPVQPRWRRNQHLRSWLIRGDAIRGYSQFIETNWFAIHPQRSSSSTWNDQRKKLDQKPVNIIEMPAKIRTIKALSASTSEQFHFNRSIQFKGSLLGQIKFFPKKAE